MLPSLSAMFLVPFSLYSLPLAPCNPEPLEPWPLEVDREIADLM